MWHGTIPDISQMSDMSFDVHCREVWNAINIQSPSTAWGLWSAESGFWGIEWQENWMVRQYNLLCDYIEEHCIGQAELKIVNFSGDKSEIRKHLYKQFGTGSAGDIHKQELDFEKGMPEKGNPAFPIGVDIPTKLRELETRRLYFWKMCDPSKEAS